MNFRGYSPSKKTGAPIGDLAYRALASIAGSRLLRGRGLDLALPWGRLGGCTALWSVGQQPDKQCITRTLFCGLAMVEFNAIYCLVVSDVLIFVYPFLIYFKRL